MEFWAVEVKNGETSKVQPGEGMVLHLSQANLGELKKEKANECVCMFVNVDGKKLVLGNLSADKLPQQQFDLVFDRDFELSHNWKGGSVYFYGYRAANPIEEEDEGVDFDSDSEEEDIPLTLENNGKPEIKAKEEKQTASKKSSIEKDSAAGKKTGPELVKDVEDDDSDDDDSMSDDDDDEDDDEDDSDSGDEDESDEETPAKVEAGKKRASESEPETPAANKKAKAATPQKTDGKKAGGHVATPHPSKQAGKTPANQKTPKSGGEHVCKSCSRSFGSENALESHSKAKHSAGK